MLTLAIQLAVVSGAMAIAAEPAPANWSRFRGPNGSGVAPDDLPAPVKFGQVRNLLWAVKVPSGISSPIIWGNRIFLTGSMAGKVVVFSAADELRVAAVNDLREPIMATPAVLEGHLYIRTRNHLCAFVKGTWSPMIGPP